MEYTSVRASDGAPGALLGRHVGRCPEDRALHGELLGLAPAVVVHELHQAEVQQLGAQRTIRQGGQEDVLGLQVAVRHTLRMREGEAREDLPRDVQRLVRLGRVVFEVLVERLTVEQLHDQVGAAAGHAEVVHAEHVGVLQREKGARLALEALAQLGGVHQVVVQHLHRHGGATDLLGAVHHAHAALTEHGGDAVAPVEHLTEEREHAGA
jgi:hypothetical protein